MSKDLQLIEKYFFGYGDIETRDGYFVLHRFNKAQKEFYVEKGYIPNSRFQAGIVIRCKNCTKIAFDACCFEISGFNTEKRYVIDTIIGGVRKSTEFEMSPQRVCFEFESEEVYLYFPYDAEIGIKNLEINGMENPTCGVALCYGDSITQGFMTHSHSVSYPSFIGREMNLNVYNFGIGGFNFDHGVADGVNLKPKFVSFFYGTNDWNFEEDYEAELVPLYKTIGEMYSDIPVFIILPIPRRNENEVKKGGTLADVSERIKKEALKYSNFNILRFNDKLEVERDLCPDGIHPSDEGMVRLAGLILDEIKQGL